MGVEIARAIDKSQAIVHPADPNIRGIAGTILTGPARDEASDLRNVTVVASGAVDRSPSGTGTSAAMAVIDAMGMLSAERRFVHESLIGTSFTGRLAGRTAVGDYPAIVADIEGSAWITGEHTFVVEDGDPLGTGFRL
jgi:proline racemase